MSLDTGAKYLKFYTEVTVSKSLLVTNHVRFCMFCVLESFSQARVMILLAGSSLSQLSAPLAVYSELQFDLYGHIGRVT